MILNYTGFSNSISLSWNLRNICLFTLTNFSDVGHNESTIIYVCTSSNFQILIGVYPFLKIFEACLIIRLGPQA